MILHCPIPEDVKPGQTETLFVNVAGRLGMAGLPAIGPAWVYHGLVKQPNEAAVFADKDWSFTNDLSRVRCSLHTYQVLPENLPVFMAHMHESLTAGLKLLRRNLHIHNHLIVNRMLRIENQPVLTYAVQINYIMLAREPDGL